MPSISELTAKLQAGCHLSEDEIKAAVTLLAEQEPDEEAKASFLVALADKGETPDEIAALARAFRSRAIDPGVGEWSAEAIDIVGTGGDHAGGFNISSLVVLVLASAGVKVMKHGNRGITSKCGSADLLGGFGVRLDAPPEKVRAALRELGFAFFFAPAYHPAFKHIAPVRKLLAGRGRRTVFNILGPLLNPGRPAHILLGVYAGKLVPVMAGALEALGTGAGLVAHGKIDAATGIDELTTATLNEVRGVGRLRPVAGPWRGEDFGFAPAPFADLLGGDLTANLALTEAILDGRAPRGLVDTIVFNAATALWITGRTPDVGEGAGLARDRLLGGAVREKIRATRDFYHP